MIWCGPRKPFWNEQDGAEGAHHGIADRILEVVEHLPKSVSARVLAGQLARSGTSVAANYRAVLRAKSRADFLNKLVIVLEEADETELWLELIARRKLLPAKRLAAIRGEAGELVRIFNAARATTKKS